LHLGSQLQIAKQFNVPARQSCIPNGIFEFKGAIGDNLSAVTWRQRILGKGGLSCGLPNYWEGHKMNIANQDWIAILINWFPMLLIFGVWVFFLRRMQSGKGLYGNQRRIADALERIADALEKRR